MVCKPVLPKPLAILAVYGYGPRRAGGGASGLGFSPSTSAF
jgi:hypothetical protein